jgi:hypothetical protein
MFWSRRLGQLPCGEWGEFCNGLRRYSSAAITTALQQVMVERNDAKEEDAMSEKRDIKETASLFGRRSALVLVAAVLPPPPGQPVPPYDRITEIYF